MSLICTYTDIITYVHDYQELSESTNYFARYYHVAVIVLNDIEINTTCAKLRLIVSLFHQLYRSCHIRQPEVISESGNDHE